MLPEVDAGDLTADRIQRSIDDHGSLVVRDLVPSSDVERLKEDIDRAFAARDEGSAPWYVEYDPSPMAAAERSWAAETGCTFAADSPPAYADLIRVFESTGLWKLITAYLGEPPVLSAKKTSLRRADRTVGSAWWHQDGAFLGEHVKTLSVWLSLSDCGIGAPGLNVVGKQLGGLVPRGTEGAHFDWSVADSVVASIGDIATPVFRPGDALFFDHYTLHRTFVVPTMPDVRYAIETWFFAASTPPIAWVPINL